MKRLKMKKNTKKFIYIFIILAIFISIGTYSGIKIYKQKQYEKTSEFKLLQIGYDKNDVTTILEKYKNKEIDYILSNELNKNYLNILNEQYFIYDYFYDYLEYYQDNNEEKTLKDTIEIINTKRNYEYYTNTEQTDISKNELLLVNKYHHLKDDYEPDNLVTISQSHAWGDAGYHKATSETYNAFLEMWEAAHEEGHYLMVSSSFRTHKKQISIYKEYEDARGTEYADKYAARPGYSEHQTGLALDIFEKNNSKQATFHESDAYLWLKNNSYKYGFILRYPENKEDITGYSFESWHYRYVGKDAAKYIYNNNITFDEYYAYFVK